MTMGMFWFWMGCSMTVGMVAGPALLFYLVSAQR